MKSKTKEQYRTLIAKTLKGAEQPYDRGLARKVAAISHDAYMDRAMTLDEIKAAIEEAKRGRG